MSVLIRNRISFAAQRSWGGMRKPVPKYFDASAAGSTTVFTAILPPFLRRIRDVSDTRLVRRGGSGDGVVSFKINDHSFGFARRSSPALASLYRCRRDLRHPFRSNFKEIFVGADVELASLRQVVTPEIERTEFGDSDSCVDSW